MENLSQNRDRSQEPQLTRKFITSKAENILEWLRRKANSDSLWPMVFGDSCCTNEYTQSQTLEYQGSYKKLDFVYFPSSLSDLMIISGPINYNLLPELIYEYEQMKSPKWVIAIGACAMSGGPFSGSYNIVSNLEKHIPIDIFIPGCPPSPEAIINGINLLRKHIRKGEFTYA